MLKQIVFVLASLTACRSSQVTSISRWMTRKLQSYVRRNVQVASQEILASTMVALNSLERRMRLRLHASAVHYNERVEQLKDYLHDVKEEILQLTEKEGKKQDFMVAQILEELRGLSSCFDKALAKGFFVVDSSKRKSEYLNQTKNKGRVSTKSSWCNGPAGLDHKLQCGLACDCGAPVHAKSSLLSNQPQSLGASCEAKRSPLKPHRNSVKDTKGVAENAISHCNTVQAKVVNLQQIVWPKIFEGRGTGLNFEPRQEENYSKVKTAFGPLTGGLAVDFGANMHFKSSSLSIPLQAPGACNETNSSPLKPDSRYGSVKDTEGVAENEVNSCNELQVKAVDDQNIISHVVAEGREPRLEYNNNQEVPVHSTFKEKAKKEIAVSKECRLRAFSFMDDDAGSKSNIILEASVKKPWLSASKQRRGYRRLPCHVTSSDIELLVMAVDKLGVGRWKEIKETYFSIEKNLSAANLKDKWRSLLHSAKLTASKQRSLKPSAELAKHVLQLDMRDKILCTGRLPETAKQSAVLSQF